MAATFLLKIDGIKGESPFDGYSDYMQIDTWRVGGTQTGTFGAGTRVALEERSRPTTST